MIRSQLDEISWLIQNSKCTRARVHKERFSADVFLFPEPCKSRLHHRRPTPRPRTASRLSRLIYAKKSFPSVKLVAPTARSPRDLFGTTSIAQEFVDFGELRPKQVRSPEYRSKIGTLQSTRCTNSLRSPRAAFGTTSIAKKFVEFEEV